MNSLIVENHLSSSTKSIHICSQCPRTFKDINNFREHLFQEHGELGINIRRCHLCSYATLLKSKYDCHIRCHLNNRILRCQKCNYSTINIRHMSKHERLSHVINKSISKVKRARIENTNNNYTNETFSLEDKSNCIRCSHQDSLGSLRTNVLILLRKLFPQLSIYYPSALTIDRESDSSIDRLVANLIQIQAFYRPYPSI